MEHEKLKELLSAFYDDELETMQKNLVTNHLQSCQNCSLTLESWKKIKQISFSRAPLQIQENFAEKVMAKIEKKSNPFSFPLFDLSKYFNFPQWKTVFALSSLIFILIFPLERNLTIQEESDSSGLLLENFENSSLQSEDWLFSENEMQKEDFMKIIFEKHNEKI